MNSHPSPFLCFLSGNNQSLDICLRYWALAENGTWREKVTALQEHSGRSQRELLALISASSRSFVQGISCRDCGGRPEIGTRQQFVAVTRSFVSKGHVYRCKECAQAEQAQQLARIAAEEEHKQAQLMTLLAKVEERLLPIDYESLGYIEAFFLYAVLVDAGERWQGRHINALTAQLAHLAPTTDMASAIYMRLCNERIIAPSSSSSPRAFVVDDVTGKFNFFPLETTWTLAVPINGIPIESILVLLEKVLDQHDPVAVAELWSMVAEAECERYFGELCVRYRLSKEVVFNDKVADAIRYCLERVSLPQVWNILWYTMREIAALIHEGKYIRPHVYNMVPGNIRRDIDRKIANRFVIRPWARLRYEKEPIITGILFDKVFGGGDLAFESVTAKNVVTFFS